MHGIGQLQMHTVIPQAVAPLDKQMGVLDVSRTQLELDTLGFHYGQVSAELAQLWNFPPTLVAAMRHIAKPLAAPEFSEAAAWVHMGTWRARCEVLSLSPEDQATTYPVEVGRRLHLDSGWTGTLANQLPQDDSSLMPPLLQLTEGLEVMFE